MAKKPIEYEWKIQIGTRILMLRGHKRIKRTTFSEMTGISVDRLKDIDFLKVDATPEELSKITEALEVSIEDLEAPIKFRKMNPGTRFPAVSPPT